jgi:hypothetical protein
VHEGAGEPIVDACPQTADAGTGTSPDGFTGWTTAGIVAASATAATA